MFRHALQQSSSAASVCRFKSDSIGMPSYIHRPIQNWLHINIDWLHMQLTKPSMKQSGHSILEAVDCCNQACFPLSLSLSMPVMTGMRDRRSDVNTMRAHMSFRSVGFLRRSINLHGYRSWFTQSCRLIIVHYTWAMGMHMYRSTWQPLASRVHTGIYNFLAPKRI